MAAYEMVKFSNDQVELVKRTIAKGSTNDELMLFLRQCERTGLDPFARQIYMRKQWDSKEQREVMTTGTAIDGFRLIAERSGKYAGQMGPMWCGQDGIWVDVWLKNEPPAAAKVAVIRTDFKEPLWSVAKFTEYVQTKKDGTPNSMWMKMPASQLAKCAESLALRKSFPQDLSGLYTSEEMGQANVIDIIETHVPNNQPVLRSEPLPQLVEEPPMYDAERDFPPVDEMPLRYAPLALQAYIKKLSESFADIECNEKQDALMASMMSAALGGVEDKRHELGFFLIGVSSMKEMSAGEKRALLKWLQPEKNAEGKYIPNAMAVREANAAYAYSVNALNAAEQPA